MSIQHTHARSRQRFGTTARLSVSLSLSVCSLKSHRHRPSVVCCGSISQWWMLLPCTGHRSHLFACYNRQTRFEQIWTDKKKKRKAKEVRLLLFHWPSVEGVCEKCCYKHALQHLEISGRIQQANIEYWYISIIIYKVIVFDKIVELLFVIKNGQKAVEQLKK